MPVLALLLACSGGEATELTGGGTAAPKGSSAQPGTGGATDPPAEAPADQGSGQNSPAPAPTTNPGVNPTTCTGTELFCDTFDSYPLGDAATSVKWTADLAGGTVAIDDTRARAGKALKVHTDANGRALLRVSIRPEANSFFGRMYVWLRELPTAPNYALYNLVEVGGAAAPTVVRPLGGQFIAEAGNKQLWGVGTNLGATGNWTRWKETAPTEAQKWTCMEWQIDATDNAVRVWIDGTAKPELTVSTKDHGGTAGQDFVLPTIDQLTFGWRVFQENPAPATFDTWIDDVSLRATRIGCF